MAGDLPGLGARLAEIVGAAHATQASRELAAVGVSTLPESGPPSWLARPGSTAEIAALVRLAASEGAILVPVGTASRKPSARGARPRILLDMRRLAHVLALDETSLVVQVQAGITGLALEELLVPRGLTLGDYPPAVLRSTIGGMLSVRTPGKGSARHGLLEDAVLGVSAVLAGGRTIHTRVAPRRATGPDLARALVGAEGRMGILTDVVLRIHRRAEARLLDAARFPSFGPAIDTVFAALRRDARPAAARVYDGPEARAQLGGEVCGLDQAVLVAGTAGPPELAALDRDLLAEEARARGGEPLGPGPAEIWWRRRHGHAVPGAHPPAPAFEVFAAPSRLAAVHEAIVAAATGAGQLARAHATRFDGDGGCLFVTLLTGERAEPHGPGRAAALAAAEAAGGHLVGARDPDLERLTAALHAELDPEGVLGGALY